MSLPSGAFFTSIDGRKCTAVPRNNATSTGSIESTTSIEEDSPASTAEGREPNVSTTAADDSTSEAITESSSVSTSTSFSTSSTSISLASSTSSEDDTSTTTTSLPQVQNPEITQTPVPDETSTTPEATPTTPPPAKESASSDPTTFISSIITPPAGRLSPSDTSALGEILFTDTGSPSLPPPTSTAADSASTSISVPDSDIGGTSGDSGNRRPDNSVDDQSSSDSSPPAGAIVGGALGGLAALSLLAFLLWFWRKKATRKRRSTLLTPLSIPPITEKGRRPYEFDEGSVGPTPRRTKFAAAVGYGVKRFGDMLTSSDNESNAGVNMNRGTSQFMEPIPTHSRNTSVVSTQARDEISTKDRFFDWWSRLTEDVRFNWRLRNDQPAGAESFAVRGVAEGSEGAGSNQPDFRTLLGQAAPNVRDRNGSIGSGDHFLGALNLNFDGTGDPSPFSDANAVTRWSKQPGPLVVRNPTTDPFSDANAVQPPPAPKPPTNYVADVRRSRANSRAAVDTRDSQLSLHSRQNRFRSNPFDLEIEPGGPAVPPAPPPAVVPAKGHGSIGGSSSRYTSGVSSMGDWSDPGPDVGPGVRRSVSQGSGGVGKAL